MPHCPECEADIDLEDDDVEEGHRLDCPDCGAALEVVSTNPLVLNVVPDEEEEEEQNW
ncbi:MAG TPA: lysine biosynthesis protein LysW [Terriglobia bacterium]|nr:lysine biosynthesis protein LysW [Terriglobia bacterium]